MMEQILNNGDRMKQNPPLFSNPNQHKFNVLYFTDFYPVF